MKLLPLALAALIFPLCVGAEESGTMQAITLKDSGVINAEITEVTGGFYLINAPALGEMKIPTGNVLSIRKATYHNVDYPETDAVLPASENPADASAEQSVASALQLALSSKVKNFLSTGDGMAAAAQISEDHDWKAVLADPTVMKAIRSKDGAALISLPSVSRLMESSQTKSLIQSILNPGTQTSSKEKKPSAPSAHPST
ncbi:MAG: hypothetical protein WCS65_11430 [Verrucomicrobiae bacterium]